MRYGQVGPFYRNPSHDRRVKHKLRSICLVGQADLPLAPSFPIRHIIQHIKTRGWRYLTNLPFRARWSPREWDVADNVGNKTDLRQPFLVDRGGWPWAIIIPFTTLSRTGKNNSGWAGMNWGGVADSRISPRPFGG